MKNSIIGKKKSIMCQGLADTHARYAQFRIKNSLLDGIMSRYPQNAFTVVSVDNLDFIHSFARVYCGKQQLSWHGTTMQIVQPQPTALTDNCVLDRQTETHAEPTTNSDTCLCHEQEQSVLLRPLVK